MQERNIYLEKGEHADKLRHRAKHGLNGM